ncbi:MAG: RagB/SusD family nutrient uptake outer membrane protein [Filimonas sp.]|nr:RagB/SusD family nutrient uptake outer membrane protein [Filimonas sp.]
MKNIKYIQLFVLLAGLATIFNACSKKLDEYNPSGLTANTTYTNATGFETLVNAAYTFNRYWYGKEEGFSYAEMGTDIWTSGTGDANPQFAQYLNLQGSNANGGAGTTTWTSLWNDLYAAVNLCNLGITNISAIPDYTAAQKTTREAELRFLRAFYYWHIVETWGGVHFTTVPTDGAVTTANRTPVDTFYNRIFADLQFAVTNLPATTTDYGRATQPVAQAFLARMYLTRGMNAQAIGMANSVIANPNFKLETNYADLWKMSNLKSKEVVWAVDYSTNLTYNDAIYYSNAAGVPQRGSNNGHLLFIMLYDKANTKPLIRDIPYGRPFNRFMPTMAYLNMFDATKDARYKGSFQDVWLANQAAPGYAIGDTAVYCAKTKFTPHSSKYVTYDLGDVYNTTTGAIVQRNYYPTLSKFLDPTRTSIAEVQSARDAFVIRLAEMYLVAAEAEMNIGKNDSAAYYINVIRTRAALPGHVADMQITPAQVNLDFILDERARELGGEQLRWFDLKRTGKLLDRVKTQNLNPDAAKNIQTFHTLRPIPQAQIDAVTNKDVFKQNPGYQ